MCAHVQIGAHASTHIYMYMHTLAHKHAHMCTHTEAGVHMHTHRLMHKHVYACLQACRHRETHPTTDATLGSQEPPHSMETDNLAQQCLRSKMHPRKPVREAADWTDTHQEPKEVGCVQHAL